MISAFLKTCNGMARRLTETMCEVSMRQWLLSTSSLTSPSRADTSCGEFWFMLEHVPSARISRR